MVFFAQPEKPERAILANPKASHSTLSPDLMGTAAYDDLLDVIHSPDAIHGMIEDDRASIRIDHEQDSADREVGRRVTCPMLCGFGIDSGHHVAEDNPEALAAGISAFL